MRPYVENGETFILIRIKLYYKHCAYFKMKLGLRCLDVCMLLKALN